VGVTIVITLSDVRAMDFIDYLIVGGGSAGCVLAGRLSERADLRIVLVESGPTFSPEDEPAAIADLTVRSFYNPDYMWSGLTAHSRTGDSAAMPYGHARVLGGGSSVNGMLAQRGLPSDYDEWQSMGVTGWSWQDVLPFYRKAENDPRFPGPLHGNSGPLVLHRYKRTELSGFERAIGDVVTADGGAELADLNGLQEVGFAPIPLSMANGRRLSAVRAYLNPGVMKRPNLMVLGRTEVRRLLIENLRVAGVELRDASGQSTVRAKHVVLCGGAIASPALLLRSGIGDSAAFARFGVVPVIDRPGVGRNLQNHPTIMLATLLSRAGRLHDRRPSCVSAIRYSSGADGCGPADMMVSILGSVPVPTAWSPIRTRVGALMAILHKPYSRGEVTLDENGEPRITFNMLADPRDYERILNGWRYIRRLVACARAAGMAHEAFVPLTLGPTADTAKTALISTAASLALDSFAAVRRKMIRAIGIPIDQVSEEAAALREWVGTFTSPAYHPAGTCRMGSPDDSSAVVDSRCRVIGISGLSVADTSIFPTLMRAGTNFPAIMAGEKCAAEILEDERAGR